MNQPLFCQAHSAGDFSGQPARRTKVARAGSSGAAKKLLIVSEHDLQRQIIQYVETVVPRALIFAVPNSSVRTHGGRPGNLVPGLKAGIFDLCLVCPGGFVGFIEVKTANGRLRKEQEEIRGRFVSLGTPHAVVRSIDDVRAALEHWTIEMRERRG